MLTLFSIATFLIYYKKPPCPTCRDPAVCPTTVSCGSLLSSFSSTSSSGFGLKQETVATGVRSQDIKPRQTTTLTDLGYADGAKEIASLGYPPRGWYDAQSQGANNDYCRAVGKSPMIFWSCALAGNTNQYTRADRTLPIFSGTDKNILY